MRIVYISDIYAEAQPTDKPKEGNMLFEHGGKGNWERFTSIAAKYGFELTKYYKGMEFKPDDVVYFCDRQLLHFYKGWKMLLKSGMLGRSVAELIESDVGDRKCSQRVLRRIKKSFPFFLTYQDDLIDNEKYYKLWPSIDVPAGVDDKLLPWDELLLAAMISSNILVSETPGEQYSMRKHIVEWFEAHPEYRFKVFGTKWDGYANYGGRPDKKSEAYGISRFAFCLENCRRNGYITEKIFDCLKGGVVPVYLGAPNVTDYIPADCFIDYASFDSFQDIVNFLSAMTEDEYNKYRENIKRFLSGDLSRFTEETQIRNISLMTGRMTGKFKVSSLTHFRMWWNTEAYEKYVKFRIKFKTFTRFLDAVWKSGLRRLGLGEK